ncbi:MAG: hypothetical protein OHK0046_36950 [Anaerolineae bacterium]
MTICRSATFNMDSLPSQFNGYTAGEMWNGWACPFFEREEAEKVLSASEANGYRWEHNAVDDTYIVRHVDDPADYEAEIISPVTIQVNDIGTIKAYAIGAYSWTWQEA